MLDEDDISASEDEHDDTVIALTPDEILKRGLLLVGYTIIFFVSGFFFVTKRE
jgi:hypothetical protein